MSLATKHAETIGTDPGPLMRTMPRAPPPPADATATIVSLVSCMFAQSRRRRLLPCE